MGEKQFKRKRGRQGGCSGPSFMIVLHKAPQPHAASATPRPYVLHSSVPVYADWPGSVQRCGGCAAACAACCTCGQGRDTRSRQGENAGVQTWRQLRSLQRPKGCMAGTWQAAWHAYGTLLLATRQAGARSLPASLQAHGKPAPRAASDPPAPPAQAHAASVFAAPSRVPAPPGDGRSRTPSLQQREMGARGRATAERRSRAAAAAGQARGRSGTQRRAGPAHLARCR